jgi:Dolichyl-phosphate-mannose-protein mannosyltransferase
MNARNIVALVYRGLNMEIAMDTYQMKIVPYIKQHKWLILIVLLGSVLRLSRLDHFSLWMDEIFTMNDTNPKLSFKEFRDTVHRTEGFPYLYFLLLKGFFAIFGYSGFAARLFSALVGIAGIIAIYKFGKHLVSKNAGLFAAFLLAINEFHLYYSQEGRPYTLFFLFTIITFYRLSVFIKAPTLKNAIWYGVAAGFLLNFNFFGLIIMFSQALLLLLLLPRFFQKQYRLQVLGRSALAGLIAIAMFAPNYDLLKHLMSFDSFWVPAPQPDSLSLLLKQLLGNYEATLFIFGFIFLFYMVTVFRGKDSGSGIRGIMAQPYSYSFLIMFFWVVVFTAYIYTKSYVGISLMLDRYFIGILPACLLILGIGISMIRNNIAKWALIATVLFFSIFNLLFVKHYYTKSNKTELREITAFITKNNKDKVPVYTPLKYFYDFYLNNDTIKTNVVERNLEDHVTLIMQDTTQRKSFWYTNSGSPYTLSPEAEANLLKYFDPEISVDMVDVWAKYYNLKTDGPSSTAKATVGAEKFDLQKFSPLKPLNGSPMSCIVEKFSFANNILEASGWACFPGGPAAQTKIQAVLIKEPQAWCVPLHREARKDVTAYLKTGHNVDDSGFMIREDLGKLAPGTYKLGIYLVNNSLNRESLLITDKIIQKN